jgi:hypothetical protein
MSTETNTENTENTEQELSPFEMAKKYPHFIHYDKYNVSLRFSIDTMSFYDDVSNLEVLKYLKGQFTNKTRFQSRFIDLHKDVKNQKVDFDETVELSLFNCDDAMDELLNAYDDAKPYTYEEAFKIENDEFRAKVFGSIDIVEMIKELGHERIATEGKHLRHKQFSQDGEFQGYVEYDVIYETHKVNGEKLNIEGDDSDVYALRCWCTTTDKEHWLWIEDEYKDNPLEAVAQTFRVHSSIIPHITEIKRQGDILLVELDSDISPSDDDEIVPLTSEQYFGFLTAQS